MPGFVGLLTIAIFVPCQSGYRKIFEFFLPFNLHNKMFALAGLTRSEDKERVFFGFSRNMDGIFQITKPCQLEIINFTKIALVLAILFQFFPKNN